MKKITLLITIILIITFVTPTIQAYTIDLSLPGNATIKNSDYNYHYVIVRQNDNIAEYLIANQGRIDIQPFNYNEDNTNTNFLETMKNALINLLNLDKGNSLWGLATGVYNNIFNQNANEVSYRGLEINVTNAENTIIYSCEGYNNGSKLWEELDTINDPNQHIASDGKIFCFTEIENFTYEVYSTGTVVNQSNPNGNIRCWYEDYCTFSVYGGCDISFTQNDLINKLNEEISSKLDELKSTIGQYGTSSDIVNNYITQVQNTQNYTPTDLTTIESLIRGVSSDINNYQEDIDNAEWLLDRINGKLWWIEGNVGSISTDVHYLLNKTKEIYNSVNNIEEKLDESIEELQSIVTQLTTTNELLEESVEGLSNIRNVLAITYLEFSGILNNIEEGLSELSLISSEILDKATSIESYLTINNFGSLDMDYLNLYINEYLNEETTYQEAYLKINQWLEEQLRKTDLYSGRTGNQLIKDTIINNINNQTNTGITVNNVISVSKEAFNLLYTSQSNNGTTNNLKIYDDIFLTAGTYHINSGNPNVTAYLDFGDRTVEFGSEDGYTITLDENEFADMYLILSNTTGNVLGSYILNPVIYCIGENGLGYDDIDISNVKLLAAQTIIQAYDSAISRLNVHYKNNENIDNIMEEMQELLNNYWGDSNVRNLEYIKLDKLVTNYINGSISYENCITEMYEWAQEKLKKTNDYKGDAHNLISWDELDYIEFCNAHEELTYNRINTTRVNISRTITGEDITVIAEPNIYLKTGSYKIGTYSGNVIINIKNQNDEIIATTNGSVGFKTITILTQGYHKIEMVFKGYASTYNTTPYVGYLEDYEIYGASPWLTTNTLTVTKYLTINSINSAYQIALQTVQAYHDANSKVQVEIKDNNGLNIIDLISGISQTIGGLAQAIAAAGQIAINALDIVYDFSISAIIAIVSGITNFIIHISTLLSMSLSSLQQAAESDNTFISVVSYCLSRIPKPIIYTTACGVTMCVGIKILNKTV